VLVDIGFGCGQSGRREKRISTIERRKGRKAKKGQKEEGERTHLKLLRFQLSLKVLQLRLDAFTAFRKSLADQFHLLKKKAKKGKKSQTHISPPIHSNRFSTLLLASFWSCFSMTGPTSLKTLSVGVREESSCEVRGGLVSYSGWEDRAEDGEERAGGQREEDRSNGDEMKGGRERKRKERRKQETQANLLDPLVLALLRIQSLPVLDRLAVVCTSRSIRAIGRSQMNRVSDVTDARRKGRDAPFCNLEKMPVAAWSFASREAIAFGES
jgi:hypothetical protein